MASFPELDSTSHIKFQLPFTEIQQFVVIAADLECGKSYTRSENSEALLKFDVVYTALTGDELTVLEAFFEEMLGRMGEFDFTYTLDDGTPIAIPRCRFDQDELVVTYPEPGRYSTEVKISAEP